jgi:short subunit dehydrogenase-like uncharacterized protein
MSDDLLIYGATGYTGRLILAELLTRGVRPVLAGRNEAGVAALAERSRLSYRVAPLTDPLRLDQALRGIRVVLNAAGPFSATAAPMVEACLRAGVHYLDIAGEVDVIEAHARRHATARARGIMILPGAGFDVVPSDCLALHVARQVRRPVRLAIGISGLETPSRGSAKTFVEYGGRSVLIRRNGCLTPAVPGTLERDFDYGRGPIPSVNMQWGDVASAFYSTGIPNIEVYFVATPVLRTSLAASRTMGWALTTAPAQVWLKMHADLLPEGPTTAERAAVRTVVVAEVTDAEGRCVRGRLTAPQSYSLTALTAAEIARRVLGGDSEPGFQTPARLYGADFVLGFAGVTREALW